MADPIQIEAQKLVASGIKSTYVADSAEHPDGGFVRELRFFAVKPDSQGAYGDAQPMLVIRVRGAAKDDLELTFPRDTVSV